MRKNILRVISSIVIVFILSGTQVFGQDGSFNNSDSSGFFMDLHLYPASLILSALIAIPSLLDDDNDDDNQSSEKIRRGDGYFTNLYLTFEFGLIRSFGFVVTPSYQGWNFVGEGYKDEGKLHHHRIGCDLGLRFYLSGNKQVRGLFVQATGGKYRLSRKIKYPDDSIKASVYKAALYQGMGYLGYQHSNGISFILGVGYNNYKERESKYGYSKDQNRLENFLTQRGLAFDFSVTGRIPII